MRVAVTGAAGYIGGETVFKLLDLGHAVLAIDHREPRDALMASGAEWCVADFVTAKALSRLFHFGADAVIHCAGTSLVGPSIMDPRLYYDNNFVKTKRLCDFLVDQPRRPRVIFSSSAAVYGEPARTPCVETDPAVPISPYGESKLMIERMLTSYGRAYGLDSVSFRYFNACGADSQARHGQEPGATHLIAQLLEAIRDGRGFVLNGNTYPTADGTCVRDYIHVEDLADAHIRAMDSTVPAGVYNLGNTVGHSNLEVITAAVKATGKGATIFYGDRRAGDPALLTANADRFAAVSGWQPRFTLDDTVAHAWAWYTR